MTRKQKSFKVILFVYTTFELFLCAAPLFGWPALVYILRNESYYGFLCGKSKQGSDFSTVSANSTTATTQMPVRASAEPVISGTPTQLSTFPLQGNTRNKTERHASKTDGIQTLPYPQPKMINCRERETQLNGIYVTSVILTSVSLLPASFLTEKYGPRVCRVISSLLYLSSGLTWIFATKKLPFLVHLASALLAAAGSMSSFPLLQLSALVFDKYQGTVISIENGAIDGGAAILLVFKLLYDSNIKLSFLWALSMYCGFVATLVLIATFTLVPSRDRYILLQKSKLLVQLSKSEIKREMIDKFEKRETGKTINKLTPSNTKNNDLTAKSDGIAEKGKPLKYPSENTIMKDSLKNKYEKDSNRIVRESESEDLISTDEFYRTEFGNNAHLAPGTENACHHTDAMKPILTNRGGLRESIFSSLYLWELLFMSTTMLRMYFYVSSLDNLLINLSKKPDTLSKYTNIFGMIQFTGLIFAPLVGPYVDGKLSPRTKAQKSKKEPEEHAVSKDHAGQDSSVMKGYSEHVHHVTDNSPGRTHHVKEWSPDSIYDDKVTVVTNDIQKLQRYSIALAITNTLGILMEAVVLIPLLQVQIISMVFQVAMRGFLYAVHFSYIAVAFPPKHYGKLASIAMLVGCVASCIQYPLISLMEGPLKGDPSLIHLSLLLVSFVVYGQSIHISIKLRKLKKKKIQSTAHSASRLQV